MSFEARAAERLDSQNPAHLERAADIIKDGGIVAFPYNGIFGLFGDIDRESSVDKILDAKRRPTDKKLVATTLPEHIHELADLKKIHIPESTLQNIWTNIHALGLILPAAPTAPYYLVVRENGGHGTILSIWTEYGPLRYMVNHLRKLSGRALVATSANKSGQPTHWRFSELWEDFKYDVDAVVEADFNHLPDYRRKSTSVVDFTGTLPRLHREGNVPESELVKIFREHDVDLYAGRDVIQVRGKH